MEVIVIGAAGLLAWVAACYLKRLIALERQHTGALETIAEACALLDNAFHDEGPDVYHAQGVNYAHEVLASAAHGHGPLRLGRGAILPEPPAVVPCEDGSGMYRVAEGCPCYTCQEGGKGPMLFTMITCPKCDNKRCPRATHHDHACTGSNDPGQLGSRYPRVPEGWSG